jgi:hypothetical protein
MRLMAKYSSLEGRKRKVYRSKAGFARSPSPHGYTLGGNVWVSTKMERLRGNGSRLIEALHREMKWKTYSFPHTQLSLRAYDE